MRSKPIVLRLFCSVVVVGGGGGVGVVVVVVVVVVVISTCRPWQVEGRFSAPLDIGLSTC